MTWTQPICEADWINQNSTGDGVIKRPVRLKEPHVETCAWCGRPTIFGVYVRADPASVPYPAEDDED